MDSGQARGERFRGIVCQVRGEHFLAMQQPRECQKCERKRFRVCVFTAKDNRSQRPFLVEADRSISMRHAHYEECFAVPVSLFLSCAPRCGRKEEREKERERESLRRRPLRSRKRQSFFTSFSVQLQLRQQLQTLRSF